MLSKKKHLIFETLEFFAIFTTDLTPLINNLFQLKIKKHICSLKLVLSSQEDDLGLLYPGFKIHPIQLFSHHINKIEVQGI